MARKRTSRRTGKARQANQPSKVEALARLLRANGWHRVGGHRELERKLGRSLTALERRAFNMACDSRTITDGAKRSHSATSAAVQALADRKGRVTEQGANWHLWDHKRDYGAKPEIRKNRDGRPYTAK